MVSVTRAPPAVAAAATGCRSWSVDGPVLDLGLVAGSEDKVQPFLSENSVETKAGTVESLLKSWLDLAFGSC